MNLKELTYKELKNYADEKAMNYKTKTEFYASSEYSEIYPILTDKYKKLGASAMDESGIKYGDKVFCDVESFLQIEKYEGIVTNRNGVPYVKYSNKKTDWKGRKSSKWNKGWKKAA